MGGGWSTSGPSGGIEGRGCAWCGRLDGERWCSSFFRGRAMSSGMDLCFGRYGGVFLSEFSWLVGRTSMQMICWDDDQFFLDAPRRKGCSGFVCSLHFSGGMM